MLLHHVDLGGEGKPPLVILHGLLGSSKNWRTAGADLTGRFHVRALDLRNHGRSPWAADQSFDAMVGDVIEWLDANAAGTVHLLGHSLGGKVAMRLACRHASRLRSLCVVDIAPRGYPVDRSAFDALLRLDLRGVTSRAEAEHRLRHDVPDRGTRLFLLSNLVRDEAGELAWQVNLQVLAEHLPHLRRGPLDPDDRFDGRTLFIAGGRSPFVTEADHAVIRGYFPSAEIRVLPGSGHYPNVDARKELAEAVGELAG